MSDTRSLTTVDDQRAFFDRWSRNDTPVDGEGTGGAVTPDDSVHLPPEALVAEARTTPGGWVYEIMGDYGPHDHVPPTAVRGAWKVGEDGHIIGDFIANPNHVPPPPSRRGPDPVTGPDEAPPSVIDP